MELRQLEYFIAVASEMNFSRAAEQVHVVQSALSTSVGKLEKELGVQLFDRSKQQIKITPAGELFREHARRVIRAARLAKDSMSSYRGELTGTVELGALITFGALDIPKVLGEFHREHPMVEVKLRQTSSALPVILSAVADGSLDLALVSAPNRFPAGVEMRLLTKEPMLFVCRPDHKLAESSEVAVADLADEDFIGCPPEFGLRRLVEGAFAAAGIDGRTPYEIAMDFGIAADMVRYRLGSMFMPTSEARRFPDLRALPVQPPLEWAIYLAWAKGERMRPAAAKLAELLLESTASGA